MSTWDQLNNDFQKGVIAEYLFKCNGNLSLACRELGVNRTTILMRMKALGMKSPKYYAFKNDLNSKEDVERYFRLRIPQLSRAGFVMERLVAFEFGVFAYFRKSGERFISLYLYKEHRGKNLYAGLIRHMNLPVLTDVSCELSSYLTKKDIPFKEVDLEQYS